MYLALRSSLRMSSVRMKIMLGWLTVWALLLSGWLAVTLIHTPSAVTKPAAKASTIPIPRGLAFFFNPAWFITSLPVSQAAAPVRLRGVLVALALPVGHGPVVGQLVCRAGPVVGVARVAHVGAAYPGPRVVRHEAEQ